MTLHTAYLGARKSPHVNELKTLHRGRIALRSGFQIYGFILEVIADNPNSAEDLSEAISRMPSEPLPDTPPPAEGTRKPESTDAAELPLELSEFSQRLASFGLGESPDPLLTEARPPSVRRSRS